MLAPVWYGTLKIKGRLKTNPEGGPLSGYHENGRIETAIEEKRYASTRPRRSYGRLFPSALDFRETDNQISFFSVPFMIPPSSSGTPAWSIMCINSIVRKNVHDVNRAGPSYPLNGA